MLPPTPTQHYLFVLDFNVKFPLLHLLQSLSDLKSTITYKNREKIQISFLTANEMSINVISIYFLSIIKINMEYFYL